MTPPIETLSGIPVLSLAEAAKACGVSLSTLRRKRPELKELGAAETAKGWQIPVTALIALGMMDRVTAPLHETPTAPTVKGVMTPPVETPADAPLVELEALRKEQAELLARLADAEKRAAVAEAIAGERERIIQTQASALRMLEAKAPGRRVVDDMVDNSNDENGDVHIYDNHMDHTATPPAPSSGTQERPGHRWFTLRRLLNR
jgi:hypothetical protein